MKAAIYARISTNEDRQCLDTQLLPVRDYCQYQHFEVYKEYTDQAKSRDIAHRVAWRALMDDAARGKFEAVVVFRLDRAFRSVKQMHDTLTVWDTQNIKLVSIRENFDSHTAMGRFVMNILASIGEFELEYDRERIIAGMDRARRQGTRSGKRIGRPRVTDARGFAERVYSILARVRANELSLGQAAQELSVGKSTIKRFVDGKHVSQA